MDVLKLIKDLGLEVTDSEVILIMKDKRQDAFTRFESIKQNKSATIDDLRGVMKELQAYDKTIECFEEHLK